MSFTARRAGARCGAPSRWPPRPAYRSAPTRGSAACCSTTTARTVAEGYHRGAGSPHAEADALRAGGRAPPAARPPSSPSSRATTPAAPGRARRRWSTPAYAAWSSPSADPNPVAAGGAATLRAAGVEVEQRPARRRGPGASTGSGPSPSTTAGPFVTWKFATTLDGRSAAADGTSRWVSGRAARRRHPPAARAVRRDAGRHQHRRGRRPAAHRPRRATTEPLAAPAAAGGDGACATCPRPAGLRRPAPRRVHLRTRDPHDGARRRSSRATASTSSSRAGRPWPRRSCGPGWSTRSSPTSPRCCSAPAAPAVGRPRHRHHRRRVPPRGHRRDRAGRGLDGEQPNVRSPCNPRRGALMFTGIVEELGTVAGGRGPGRRHPAHRPRRRTVLDGRRPRRLDRGQRLLPDRRRARRRHLDRRRHAGDARQDQPRRRRSPATGSTSSARSPPTTRLGGHIVQGHVDGVGTVVAPHAQRALGGRRDLPAGRPGPLPGRQGLDHRRRRQPDRRRGRRRRRSPSA